MWWKLQVPGTVSTNSYQGFRFSLTATISSLMIVRKVIPSMGDLQYSLTAQNIKIWLLTNQVRPLIINQLSATNPVAQRFPMACCKKSPCYINVQIWLGVATVQKGLTVLVLPSTAVTKIVNTFDLGQILLDVKHDYSQQLVNETGVILQIIMNDAQWDVMKYTILLEIYHHRTGCMVQWSLLQWYLFLDFILDCTVISLREWYSISLLFLHCSVWDAELGSLQWKCVL